MSYDCVCDYDPPDFYRQEIRRARKPHKCEECSGPILIGDRYEYVTGKWDGYFDSFLTCQLCVDLRTWVKNNVPCLCWSHGNGDNDMREAIAEAYWRAPAEVIGLRFGFLRRTILRNRRNAVRRAA